MKQANLLILATLLTGCGPATPENDYLNGRVVRDSAGCAFFMQVIAVDALTAHILREGSADTCALKKGKRDAV